MTVQHGGAVDHRAALDALDRITELRRQQMDLENAIEVATRDALAVPGVTQGQVAYRLGIKVRALRLRLAAMAARESG